jgi:hypothetical protein
MSAYPTKWDQTVATSAEETALAERLERGEVEHYPVCPFPLPEGDDRRFLLEQRLGSRAHKNISYDPRRDKSSGYLYQGPARAHRLHNLLADFSRVATRWLSNALPRYASGWRLDMVSYRPEEEATRKLRQKARNDLLHVDAFPSRPTNGDRILRLFVNINPTDPRIWITSDPFARLLERYGKAVGLPAPQAFGLKDWWQRGVVGIFQPGRKRRSPYDDFMLRLHDFMKANDDFQERCFKRYWNFAPGAMWLAITDTASHAVLRGRFALEHSYFLSPATLTLPAESPAALLERACGVSVLNRAA